LQRIRQVGEAMGINASDFLEEHFLVFGCLRIPDQHSNLFNTIDTLLERPIQVRTLLEPGIPMPPVRDAQADRQKITTLDGPHNQ
jgi:hypothetical protein